MDRWPPSSPAELPLRLRWLAILSGRVRASLAATGGIHSPVDAVKAVMAGAHAVQMVSALLQRGPGYLDLARVDLLLPDAAILWISDFIELYEGDTRLPRRPQIIATRVSLPSDKSFGSYEEALAHVKA